MRWVNRTVRPYAHYLAQREARRAPGGPAREWPMRRFETLKATDPLVLATHPIWLVAPLTDEARVAFARCDLEFWAVRYPGDPDPFALVIRPDRYLHARGFRGDIDVSETPMRVRMTKYDSTLVVARNLVFTCGGGTGVEGLRWLCHALDDTHISGDPDLDFWRRPRRPSPPPPIPDEDVERLGSLIP